MQMSLVAIAVNGYKPMPVELPNFKTSDKNARNECHVSTGSTFAGFEVITNITDTAKIEKIEVDLNGETIVNLTGKDVKELIEAYTKRTRAAGRYFIPFYNPEARTLDGMRAGELVTFPSDNLVITVQIGETDAVQPTLRARALVSASQDQRIVIPKLDVINFTASASGENNFDWAQRDPALQIQRLHFQAPDITRLKVYRDDLRVFNASLEDNNADLSEGGDNAPQANTFHFDPAHAGFKLQGLFATIARRDLRFVYDKTQAGSVRVVREMLKQVSGLPQ